MATPQRLETVRRIQTAMSVGYSAMGAWCLFHPASVIQLGFTQPFQLYDRTTTLLMQCFGAQAMTCGLVLGTSNMTAKSFTYFGLAMIPYIVAFNGWFGLGPGKGMFTEFMWMDFVGNCFFGLGSWYCARMLREHEAEEGKST